MTFGLIGQFLSFFTLVYKSQRLFEFKVNNAINFHFSYIKKNELIHLLFQEEEVDSDSLPDVETVQQNEQFNNSESGMN